MMGQEPPGWLPRFFTPFEESKVSDKPEPGVLGED